jgi:N-methylhydantoinase A
MKLDEAAAHRAFEGIAARFGMSVSEAAAAAIRLAVANIVRAIQIVSTERGRDPRAYALVPFGGAGPLLAAEIAAELSIREVLVPPNPGVISALGLLSADYVKVYTTTRRMRLGEDVPDKLREEHDRFQRLAAEEYRSHNLAGALDCSLEADMRYVGQAFEIAVPVDLGSLDRLSVADLTSSFNEVHRRVYMHGGEPGRMIELVGLRFSARQRLQEMPVAREREVAEQSVRETTIRGSGGEELQARIIAATGLKVGALTEGPVLIEGYSSTTWVPPGWIAERDASNNTWLRKKG